MFRMRPPPTVTQDTSATSDPSYNPASAVFVTRQGTRTVLTMETVYSGPPVELSMLIPVPTSIERDHVRTVTGSIFRNLDRRTSPRVRHVWPACRRIRRAPMRAMSAMGGGGGSAPEPQMRIEELGIEIEDEWEVDEYDITLLGADESTGLLTFLRQRGLDLKENAIPMLRAYIESDHRFVLARVDPSRANVLGDKMMLSPIQLEYESEELRVPVRLGTLNSPGQQELLLYILSDQGRFEIANRTNVTAPTDLRMRSSVRGGVAEVYASLTDEVFRQHPGAAITALVALSLLIAKERVTWLKDRRWLPGPLLAVGSGAAIHLAFSAWLPSLAVPAGMRIELPQLGGELFHAPDLSRWNDPTVLRVGFTIAVIASIETLLCVEAVDRLDPEQRRTPPNRELVAQGLGNLVAGLLGGIPMTAVIVRGSANVQSGGRSKASSIMHGLWLLLAVAIGTTVLSHVPLSAA